MTVTINDVAQAAGVSKGAVSYALNGQPGVSDDTRERILRVARELGWKPNLRAKSLSSAKAFAVGLVVARDPGFWELTPSSPHSSPGSRPPWSSTNTSWS
ncbi:HTH-type transcriptional regulator MalR [Arthrobacter sp. Hiyo8]|nr:HTH-type transcriptional regulator MalR [Arthrobacter sp. Hiyo8]